jgi:hypothetical protein
MNHRITIVNVRCLHCFRIRFRPLPVLHRLPNGKGRTVKQGDFEYECDLGGTV